MRVHDTENASRNPLTRHQQLPVSGKIIETPSPTVWVAKFVTCCYFFSSREIEMNKGREELANLIYHGWARHNRNLFFFFFKFTRWNTKFFREPFENPKSRKRKIFCASAGRRQNREWTSEIKLASAQTIPHQSDKLWTGPIRMTKSICVVSDCALKSECYGDPSFMGKAVFVL